VLDKVAGFDWDEANVGHIFRHAVTPFEVEEDPAGNASSSPREPSSGKSDGSYLARRHPDDTWSSCSPFAEGCSEP